MCVCVYVYRSIESWNQRMAWIGMVLKDHQVPTLMPQGWGTGQSVPEPHHSLSKKKEKEKNILLTSNLNHPSFSLKRFPLVLSLFPRSSQNFTHLCSGYQGCATIAPSGPTLVHSLGMLRFISAQTHLLSVCCDFFCCSRFAGVYEAVNSCVN